MRNCARADAAGGSGAVWELAFGSWVLLQPERINAYTQAVIRTLQAVEAGDPEPAGPRSGPDVDQMPMGRLPPENIDSAALTTIRSQASMQSHDTSML